MVSYSQEPTVGQYGHRFLVSEEIGINSKKKKTIFFQTHNLWWLRRLCDQLYITGLFWFLQTSVNYGEGEADKIGQPSGGGGG